MQDLSFFMFAQFSLSKMFASDGIELNYEYKHIKWFLSYGLCGFEVK